MGLGHQQWWDGEIRRFVRLDGANPPPKGGILFVGSSIFREWREMRDFDNDFAPLPVINRAFGGSMTEDQLEVMDAVVFPHEPRVLVYYCGSNDLNMGVQPAEILENFRGWCARVREGLGDDVHILFVSINRAPQKKPLWHVLDEANAAVERYCETTPHTRYVDVNAVLFDGEGKPRYDLYREDGLHFYSRAYDEFLTVMRDEVELAWREATATGKAVGDGGNGEPGAAGDDAFLPPGMRR